MNILMVTPYAPLPATTGGRIRMWELLTWLGKRHSLTLTSFAETEQEWEAIRELERVCERVVFCRQPDKLSAPDLKSHQDLVWNLQPYSSVEMEDALSQVKPHQFDAVLVETLFMARYRELLPARTVLAEYDIVSQVYKQYAELWQTRQEGTAQREMRALWKATWLWTEQYENTTWPKFPLRTTVSIQDKTEMDRRCPVGQAIVIENGVNPRTNALVQNQGTRTVLFMGTLNYVPNVQAATYLAQTIMPLVWQVEPDVRLQITGRAPIAQIYELAQDSRIQISANPVDMRAVAERAAVAVVPLQLGGGTRIKIPEAMAWGLPVVSTPLGCSGLEVVDGETILIRDDPQSFARAILELVNNDALWNRLRFAARQLVEARYDWQEIFPKLEAALENLRTAIPD